MAYDTTTKRIYRNTSATPAVGVGIEDVRQAIRESSYDLGTLCRSLKVNKWCKYKPVETSFLGETGKTSGSLYWKGDDGQCGLTIPRASNNDRSTFARGTTAWSRAVPTTKYRLLDFDGYDGNKTVSDSDPSSLPTGKLTEATQSAIAFDGGVPIFHVDLNAQDSSGYYLTINDLGLYYSSTTIPMNNMYLRLALISQDGTEVIDLPSSLWRLDPSGHETDFLTEMTIGEARAAGITQVTFSPFYAFAVESVTNAPQAGDIYSTGQGDFKIQEVILDGSTLNVDKLVCIRTNGTLPLDPSGYLVRGSGSGDPSIYYTTVEVNSITFGSRLFYVFPHLYSATGGGVICGLGLATPQITLSSVTNQIVRNIISVAKINHTTFSVQSQIINGYNEQKSVTTDFTLSWSNQWQDLFGDHEVEKTDTKTIAALSTATYNITLSDSALDGGIWTGLEVDHQEYYFDQYEQPFTPPEQ